MSSDRDDLLCNCCRECQEDGLWAAYHALRDVLLGRPTPKEGPQEFNSLLRTVEKLRRWFVGKEKKSDDSQTN